jgi:hypothetical protein
MVINNRTVFDGQEVKKSIIDENTYSFFKRLIIIIVFLILGILISIFSIKEGADSLYFTLGIALIIFAVLSLGYNLFKFFRMKKRIDKDFEYEITHGIIYDYSFHEEKFKLTITVGDRTSKMEPFYKGLKKILNYEDVIIFVISTGDAYKCKKEGFSDKRQEELFFYGLKKHNIKITNKIKETKKVA